MQSWIEKLEEKKFLLLTGKGGTGKSTISAALAIYFSSRGKKVLLAEIGRPRDQKFLRLGEFFGIDKLSTSAREVANPLRARKKISLSCIDPSEALVEYIGLKLGSQKLAQVVLKNRIAFRFLDTIPGLTELVSLGKLWHEAIRENGPDIILLDAPASGHAMAMLMAPKNFAALTRLGPLFRDAQAMEEFFQDKKKTQILYCTLPEAVPFEETEEFSALLAAEGFTALPLVNKCFPLRFDKINALPEPLRESPLRGAWEYAQYRYAAETKEMDLYRALSKKPAFLPFIFPEGEGERAHLELARSWLGEAL